MREPRPTREAGHGLFGLLAEFDRPEELKRAARRAREEGFSALDAYSPFPVEGLAETLGFRDARVPLWTLAGGVFGAAFGYGLQAYANLAFPLNVGGRPVIATTAFMLITFELLVLFAVLFGIGAMLILNGLPRLHHPVFGVETFHLASRDKFFLVVFSTDPRFQPERTRAFLESLRAIRVEDVPFSEPPE